MMMKIKFCRQIPSAKGQRGIVLFVALIALVAMTLAAIALVRSVDTSNVISGNLAFRQGAIQASDLGVEAAVAALASIASAPDTNATASTGTYWYYSSRRKEDTLGLPTVTEYTSSVAAGAAVDWASVPNALTTTNGYTIKIVIDRMCQGTGSATAVTNLLANCLVDLPKNTPGNSHTPKGPKIPPPMRIFYRATVRVDGPRNTVNYVQTTLLR